MVGATLGGLEILLFGVTRLIIDIDFEVRNELLQ